MVLFALPTDLSLAVFREWLGNIKDITRLDSSCASSVRQRFLDLARRPAGLGVPYPVKLTKENVSGFVHWTNNRCMELEFKLTLATAVLKACTAINPKVLRLMRKLTVDGHRSGTSHSWAELSMAFHDILRKTLRLECLDLQACDEFLVVLPLVQASFPLRSLTVNLKDADRTLDSACYAFSGTLEELRVSKKYAQHLTCLRHLGESCKNIRVLQLHAELSEESLQHLACDYFPCLTELILGGCRSELTADLTIKICKSHPNLTVFDSGESALQLPTLTAMLSHCAQLQVAFTAFFQLSIVHTAGSRHAQLMIWENKHVAQELPYIAFLLSCPITYFHCFSHGGTKKASLDAIIDVCGVNLHTIKFSVDEDMDAATLQRFARECNTIEFLDLLVELSANCVDDEFLMAIADHCCSLKDIRLPNCTTITDHGVQYALQQLGGQLITLHVGGMALTHMTLTSIASNCANLTELWLSSTSISMADVMRVLIRPNLLPKLTSLRGFSKEDVKVVRRVKDDEVDFRRWDRILQ